VSQSFSASANSVHYGRVKLLDELLDLLLPCRCILCAAVGSALCRTCATELKLSPRQVERFGLRGWAVTDYGEVEKTLIHAFKENGLTALAPHLATALRLGLSAVKDELPSPIDGTLLVPAPSSKTNYRKRGYQPVKILAKRLNQVSGSALRVSAGLSFTRVVADQSGLDVEERRQNLSGSMVGSSALAGQRVLLVDDIVTTGVTLTEAARAVTKAGAEVLGFLTFSETILKTQAKS
jgi:ComF family protein